MTDAQFTAICLSMKQDIQKKTPVDTGNLKLKATKGESIGSGKFKIYVDQKIAPYFRYVNNKGWSKHYRYFETAFEEALIKMAERVGGTIVDV